MTRQEYIQKFKKAAIDSIKGTGLFPSVLMAQAILESSNAQGQPGLSLLSRKYNNHFGVKADKSWKGKKVNLQTGEVYNGVNVVVGDYFRVYDNPAQSFKDRNEFLVKNPRYTKAGVFKATTPERQADALQKAGYATDPQYAAKLKSLIRTLHLKTLDELARKNESSGQEPL